MKTILECRMKKPLVTSNYNIVAKMVKGAKIIVKPLTTNCK